MSEISLDDLLKAIDNAEEKKEKQQRSVKLKDQSSIRRFISDLNIKTGLDKVPTHVIYYTYRQKWKDTCKAKKSTKIVFFRRFKELFTQMRSNSQRYYLLDATPFDMTREGLLEAEHYDKGLKSGKKTEKSKKEKRQMGQSEA